MRPSQDTDNSISDILEIFRTLRQEERQPKEEQDDKRKSCSSFSFDSKFPFNPEGQSEPMTSKGFQLQSSIRSPLSSTRHNRTSKSRQAKSALFCRLYQENALLKERREKLYKEGQRKKEVQEVKECTFKPQTLSSHDPSRKQTQGQSLHFYQRNIEWKSRVDQAVKLRQVETSKENLKQLTFSPRVMHQSRNRSSSKDSVTSKKGVSSYLERQKKARNAETLLKSRWNSLNGNSQFNNTQPNFIF